LIITLDVILFERMNELAAEVKRAREARGWTQAEAAQRLGVTQGYVSLLESGERPLPRKLVPSLLKRLGLSPSALPPSELNLDPDRLPCVLGALGYEPFGYLRGRALNPTAVLLFALRQKELPSRVVEALPWLALRFADSNREWLVERAKLHDVQNRLAYVVTLASELADLRRAARLRELVRRLERSRLAREDTLCHDSMTEAERRWLRRHRPPQARHWSLLTDLKREHLPYAPERCR
jgi:transcriptional regulator with XRE-family HTH domain